jgi:hypothetical protein
MGTDILVKNALSVGILQPPKYIPHSLTRMAMSIASFTVPVTGVYMPANHPDFVVNSPALLAPRSCKPRLLTT